ncbi:uncharacterized protein LOC129598431 isoform X2 [Paramacrobiotus metropolitanus]|nr:uncharacterized protein LOC129598431 isoform X2 [Paramacrobiotus metropolitanus]
MQLQRAQLKQIKYESSIQLIILLVLIGTGVLPFSAIPCVSLVCSFVSVFKYIPPCAHLPGKFAFNKSLLGQRDCLSVTEVNHMLRPRILILHGAMCNFLYIACRYHVFISLIIINWHAAVYTTLLQALIVVISMVWSFSGVKIQSKYTMRRVRPPSGYNESSGTVFIRCAWKRKVGSACAFFLQMATALTYFLLIPLTTTMTKLGCFVGTALQAVAIVVYLLVLHLGWRLSISSYVDTSHKWLLHHSSSLVYPTLFANAAVSCVLLPLVQLLLDNKNTASWLVHRNKCRNCLAFQSRYCKKTPCWMCDWLWALEKGNVRRYSGRPEREDILWKARYGRPDFEKRAIDCGCRL